MKTNAFPKLKLEKNYFFLLTLNHNFSFQKDVLKPGFCHISSKVLYINYSPYSAWWIPDFIIFRMLFFFSIFLFLHFLNQDETDNQWCVTVLISNHFPLLVADKTAVHLTSDSVSDWLKYGNDFMECEQKLRNRCRNTPQSYYLDCTEPGRLQTLMWLIPKSFPTQPI